MNNSEQIKNHSPLYFAEQSCNALMEKFEPAALPPIDRWHYHQGVFLLGMEHCYAQNQEEKYLDYIKAYTDSQILPDGSIKNFHPEMLDDIQPGILLFNLYEKTGDERYKKALHNLVPLLNSIKTNSEGGFWHKPHNSNQMWLDGLFMGGPIAVQYASLFNKPEYYDLIAHQALLMEKHTIDEKTGLLRHGWDESKKASWADPVTGKSEEIWGRAVGWYTVALLDIFEYLPKDHKNKPQLVQILLDLLKALVHYQDEQSGMWYQVIDKGHLPDNWLETSCSSLFVYSLAKAVRMGYLEASYLECAWKGYQGVIDSLRYDENGGIIIGDICIGTGIGDYAHYIARPRSENDLHGAGAFILMCTELNLAK